MKIERLNLWVFCAVVSACSLSCSDSDPYDDMEPQIQCFVDEQCGIGMKCLNGTCTKAAAPNVCTSDMQCGTGMVCLNGTCTQIAVPSVCTADIQCGIGMGCRNGRCVMICLNDAQCGTGMKCQNGNCVQGCTDNAQCGTGMICQNGTCMQNSTPNSCTTDEQCGAGRKCQKGSCTDAPFICSMDAQCGSGMKCIEGKCIPKQILPTPECIETEYPKCKDSSTLALCTEGKLREQKCSTGSICQNNACIDFSRPASGNITIDPTIGLKTSESGESDAFTIKLKKQPLSDVTITMRSSDESEGTVSPSKAVFGPSNWTKAQTFTIKGVDDDIKDGDITYSIIINPAQSDDPQYRNHVMTSVMARNIDDDRYKEKADIAFDTTELELYEGASKELTIYLTAEPSDDVTVSFKAQNGIVSIRPASVKFTQKDYGKRRIFTVSAPFGDDHSAHNNKDAVVMTAVSTDARYNGFKINDIPVAIRSIETDSGEAFTLRAMAANITSGRHQSYDPGDGIRIFQAVKPDVVMIQEFNYSGNTPGDLRAMVNQAFGTQFHYYCGAGTIPNGIISRFPIIQSGHWSSNEINNRNWEWSLIDIPGSKELLAVSLHLSTNGRESASEVTTLTGRLEKKIAEDRKKGLEYYIVLGGDFNSAAAAYGQTDLERIMYTDLSRRMPVDQQHEDGTNASRKKTLDLLFADPSLHDKEIPVRIGRHVYPYGHVFDTRVYKSLGEINDVPPLNGNESGAYQMQHMAVIRDFRIDPAK